MGSSSVSVCLKFFLMVVNFLFLVIGACVLGAGIYLCTSAQLGKYSEILAVMESLRSIRLVLIGCGCVVVLIGLLGCVGTCKEAKCPLIAYVILLIIVLLGLIAAIVLSLLFTRAVKDYAVDQMKDNLKRFYGNSSDPSGRAFTQSVNNIQKEESCCGWTGQGSANFFTSTPWYHRANANATKPGQQPLTFPESCCAVSGEKLERCTRATNGKDAREFGYVHADDCWDRLLSVSGRFIHATLGIVASAIVLQIVCIICTVILLLQIARSADHGIRV